MEETVVQDVNAEKPAINADSSTEDILASIPQEEAPAQEETSTSEEASNPTGEVEKTPSPEEAAKLEAEQETALIESGKPIPYDRFKQVIGKRNELQKSVSELQAQFKEVQGLFQDPDIVKAVMKKQGYADDAINTYLKNQGIAVKKEPTNIETQLEELSQGLDLTTTKGWQMYQYRVAQLVAEDKSKEALTAYDHKKLTETQANEFIASNETQAKELAEKTYKIPYGESGKDETNPNTAVGKISAYLDANPEDAYLGQAKLLRLAMSLEGFKAGEQKGVLKEKERQQKLKQAALESEEVVAADDRPDKNWTVEKIMAWRDKHPNATL